MEGLFSLIYNTIGVLGEGVFGLISDQVFKQILNYCTEDEEDYLEMSDEDSLGDQKDKINQKFQQD